MSSAGNSNLNCAFVHEHLSAFHDGELAPDLRDAVREHIEGCPECSHRLAEFRDVSRMAAELPTPPVPDEIWPQLEKKLAVRVPRQRGSLGDFIRRRRTWVGIVSAALAVVIVSTATVVWLRQREHGRAHVAVNFGLYLDEFERNPDTAQQVLLTNYEGRAVSLDEAAAQVRYRPAVQKTLPDGASLEALYLLKMPCCLCVQAVYRRDTGERLAIFEHVDDEPIWFGNRPAIHARCNGTPTSIVQVDDYLAASWRRDGRFLTVVGAKDVEQLLRLMASLDDKGG